MRILKCELRDDRSSPPRFDRRPLQLGMGGDPWRVACASVLLNRSCYGQVRRSLENLLSRWPEPRELARADPFPVMMTVRSCGFGKTRAETLVRLSGGWDSFVELRDLRGVGPYVSDAVGLFCLGRVALECDDRVLRRFVEGCPERCRRGNVYTGEGEAMRAACDMSRERCVALSAFRCVLCRSFHVEELMP